MPDVCDAFVDGHPAAEGKNQNRDDEGPEIKFLAMPKRMNRVRRFPALAHSEQQ